MNRNSIFQYTIIPGGRLARQQTVNLFNVGSNPTPGALRSTKPDWHPASVTVEDLERWEQRGAVWRTVAVNDHRALIDLCSCTGEPMERVQGDAPELIEFVRSRRAE